MVSTARSLLLLLVIVACMALMTHMSMLSSRTTAGRLQQHREMQSNKRHGNTAKNSGAARALKGTADEPRSTVNQKQDVSSADSALARAPTSTTAQNGGSPPPHHQHSGDTPLGNKQVPGHKHHDVGKKGGGTKKKKSGGGGKKVKAEGAAWDTFYYGNMSAKRQGVPVSQFWNVSAVRFCLEMPLVPNSTAGDSHSHQQRIADITNLDLLSSAQAAKRLRDLKAAGVEDESILQPLVDRIDRAIEFDGGAIVRAEGGADFIPVDAERFDLELGTYDDLISGIPLLERRRLQREIADDAKLLIRHAMLRRGFGTDKTGSAFWHLVSDNETFTREVAAAAVSSLAASAPPAPVHLKFPVPSPWVLSDWSVPFSTDDNVTSDRSGASSGDSSLGESMAAHHSAHSTDLSWHDEGNGAAATALNPCDAWNVPFSPQADAACAAYLADTRNWDFIAPVEPKFEQRTVKFRIFYRNPRTSSHASPISDAAASVPIERLFDDAHRGEAERRRQHYATRSISQSLEIVALVKVPQSMFATEPFSERIGFGLDRFFGINRVPPTVLVPMPLELLHAVIDRLASTFTLVSDFNYAEKTFPEWVEKEFFAFARRATAPKVMKNATHVWVSLQLMLRDVRPLMDTALAVPYSRAHPGWHRWFDPLFENFAMMTNTARVPGANISSSDSGAAKKWLAKKGGSSLLDDPSYSLASVTKRVPPVDADPAYTAYLNTLAHGPYNPVTHGSLLALSELSVFDYLMLNNDRSPNKNAFMVQGCYTRHLDDGSLGGASASDHEGNGGGGGSDGRTDFATFDVPLSEDDVAVWDAPSRNRGGDDKLVPVAGRSQARGGKKPHYHHNDAAATATQIERLKYHYCSSAQRAKSRRGYLGLSASIVHLDQGMSFHGFFKVNNPLVKKGNNFCLFYRPLMERVRCFVARHPDPEDAVDALLAVVPEVAYKGTGRGRFKWIAGQLATLLQKVDDCVARYGEDLVLQPSARAVEVAFRMAQRQRAADSERAPEL